MLSSFTRLLPLSALLGGLTSATAVTQDGLVERQTTTCASQMHLMIAGGCLVPCATDELGLLETLVGNITAAFPGSDQYIVPYNSAPFQAKASTPFMVAAANDYAISCPNTPIVFIGYSLGGIILMNTLCGGIDYNPNVIGAVAYGEETYRYPASYDSGTCTNDAPTYPRANTSACAAYAPIIRSYCDAADPQCCSGGLYQPQHYLYPSEYDISALEYIKSQYTAFTSRKVSSSSSTASSTAVDTTLSPKTSIVVPTSRTNTSITLSSTVAGSSSSVPSTSTTAKLVTSTVSNGTASRTSAVVQISSSAGNGTSRLSLPATTISKSSTTNSTSTASVGIPPLTKSSGAPIESGFASSMSGTKSSIASPASVTSLKNGTFMPVPATRTTAVVLYTGAAARLSMPGLSGLQLLCRAWRNVV